MSSDVDANVFVGGDTSEEKTVRGGVVDIAKKVLLFGGGLLVTSPIVAKLIVKFRNR